MEKDIVEGLENQPKPNATAHDSIEKAELQNNTGEVSSKEGKRPADNDNSEKPEGAELQNNTGEVSSKEGKRPADNDNSEPIELAKKDIADSIEIDDSDESKLVQEQEVPKVELSEDISSLIESIGLEPEHKEKALTIFEAAVAGQVADIHKKMLEVNESLMNTYKETLATKLNEKVDLYLTESVNKWLEENQVSVKSSLRAQVAESFMANVIAIMESHYIDLPEGKEDVLEETLSKVNELQEQVDSLLKTNKEYKTVIESKEKEEVFESLIKDLTDTQKERVKTLSESIKSDIDLDTYKSKVITIIEGLIPEKQEQSSKYVTEDANGNVVDKKEEVVVDKYSHIKDLAKSLY